MYSLKLHAKQLVFISVLQIFAEVFPLCIVFVTLVSVAVATATEFTTRERQQQLIHKRGDKILFFFLFLSP